MQGSKTHLVPDRELGIEYYRFEGFMRPFARHFHPHYVFGLVEEGTRTMQCSGAVHELGRDHVLLLNPGDCHDCDCGDASLTYSSLAIPADVMKVWTGASSASLPVFAPNVLRDAFPAACASCSQPWSVARKVCAKRSFSAISSAWPWIATQACVQKGTWPVARK